MEKEKERIEYSQEEILYRDDLITKLINSSSERDGGHTELDDMGYEEYYDSNKKAANSYIPPKKNPQDSNFTSGITGEKEISILSALLNYNLEPSINAFSNDEVKMEGLGMALEDLVKRSKEIEGYENKRGPIYKEMLDQGDVFVEDSWSIRYSLKKNLAKNWENLITTDLKKIEWKEKLEKVFEGAEFNIIQGTKVFLGNVKEFDLAKQPYLFTVEHVPYDLVESTYGKWERWKYVPKKIEHFSATTQDTYDEDWSLAKLEDNQAEIVKYQNKITNEYMIMINGVMMLPIKFPLTALSPSGEYTIAKGSSELISTFFAYSKSIPAKTKVDRSVFDEMLKLIVLKTQQSFKPPYINNSKRVLSSRMFYPGVITNNVAPGTVTPLIDSSGVTPSEFNAVSFIKEIIDSKSVSPTFQGESPKGNQTATEIIEMKKQQMMKLGLVITGVVLLEKQLTWLRCYNLIENWTKPSGSKADNIGKSIKDLYRTISVDTTLENGQQGTKIYDFNPDVANTITDQELRAEEEFLSKGGREVRKVYLNPHELRKLKTILYITIVPTEKNSTEIERMLFTQNISEAMQLFGPQTLNMNYIRERFAILAKEDPKKFFNPNTPDPQQQQQEQQMQQQQQQGGQKGKQVKQPLPSSLNEMLQ